MDLGPLVEWIRSRGGQVTVRDVQRGPRRYRDVAASALQALYDSGSGEWQHVGRRRVLVLATPGDTDGDTEGCGGDTSLAANDQSLDDVGYDHAPRQEVNREQSEWFLAQMEWIRQMTAMIEQRNRRVSNR